MPVSTLNLCRKGNALRGEFCHLLRRDMSEACLQEDDTGESMVEELPGPSLIGSNIVEGPY